MDGYCYKEEQGVGRTHLAASIANRSVELGVPTLFLTVPDLLDSLRFSFDSETTTFEERFDDIRKAQLLLLDDFGTQNASAWAQEKLFQIINYRYINRLSTIITTNLSLEEIEERIRSRLQDIELVKRISIDAPDYRHPIDKDFILLSPKLKSCTFANFSIRRGEGLPAESVESLQQALKICEAFAQHPQGWLIVTGDYGTGKTHLVAAVGHQCMQAGLSPLFMDVPTLLDYLRSTFSPNSMISYDRRFNQIKTSSLLILDDFGTQSATPWAREKLYQLFNYRYNMELPTIATITADSLEEIDSRIRSRMLDYRLSMMVTINVSPYHAGDKKMNKSKNKPR